MPYNDDTDNGAAAQDLYAAYRERKKAPNDQLTQDLQAPKEHEQFVEETTRRNPVAGAAALAAAPVYAAAKALGLAPGDTGDMKTSRASVDEVFAAVDGFRKGLKNR